MASVAEQMGGHIRIGLEDPLLITRGKKAKSNAQQVEKIRRILDEQGNDIATPDEAREISGFRGSDNVEFYSHLISAKS